MRYLKQSLIAIFLIFIFVGFSPEDVPFKQGEEIRFAIYYRGLRVGKAVASFKGSKPIGSKETFLFSFYTNMPTFKDLEKVYADPETFLPVRVERDLSIGGKRVNILEVYDQRRDLLKITRLTGKKNQTQRIQKQSDIQNIISLFYRCRTHTFEVGDSFEICLPTKEYKIKVTAQQQLVTPSGKHQALLFEAEPKRVRFWIGKGEDKLLLKIEYPLFLGSLSMVMTEHLHK